MPTLKSRRNLLLSFVINKMESGFPQNSGRIRPTSGPSDWLNSDPHMVVSSESDDLYYFSPKSIEKKRQH